VEERRELGLFEASDNDSTEALSPTGAPAFEGGREGLSPPKSPKRQLHGSAVPEAGPGPDPLSQEASSEAEGSIVEYEVGGEESEEPHKHPWDEGSLPAERKATEEASGVPLPWDLQDSLRAPAAIEEREVGGQSGGYADREGLAGEGLAGVPVEAAEFGGLENSEVGGVSEATAAVIQRVEAQAAGGCWAGMPQSLEQYEELISRDATASEGATAEILSLARSLEQLTAELPSQALFLGSEGQSPVTRVPPEPHPREVSHPAESLASLRQPAEPSEPSEPPPAERTTSVSLEVGPREGGGALDKATSQAGEEMPIDGGSKAGEGTSEPSSGGEISLDLLEPTATHESPESLPSEGSCAPMLGGPGESAEAWHPDPITDTNSESGGVTGGGTSQLRLKVPEAAEEDWHNTRSPLATTGRAEEGGYAGGVCPGTRLTLHTPAEVASTPREAPLGVEGDAFREGLSDQDRAEGVVGDWGDDLGGYENADWHDLGGHGAHPELVAAHSSLQPAGDGGGVEDRAPQIVQGQLTAWKLLIVGGSDLLSCAVVVDFQRHGIGRRQIFTVWSPVWKCCGTASLYLCSSVSGRRCNIQSGHNTTMTSLLGQRAVRQHIRYLSACSPSCRRTF